MDTGVACCNECGKSYGEEQWRDLALSERIEAHEVQKLLRDWPEGACIEIRRCSRCRTFVPARRPAVDWE